MKRKKRERERDFSSFFLVSFIRDGLLAFLIQMVVIACVTRKGKGRDRGKPKKKKAKRERQREKERKERERER